MTIKFGCHTSTWVLDYDKEIDVIDHIIDVVSKSGFKGLDIQVPLLGKYKDQPQQFKEKLASKGVELAAITVPFTWAGDEESQEEKERADSYINFLKNFPHAVMNLPSRVGPNREQLLSRQKQIIRSANAVGKRAFENGITASFHPASPETSYFRTFDDYQVLFELLDTRYIGYTPDCGHIKAGGMNPFDIVKDNFSIIRHVHFKDCSNDFEWMKMGTGAIDYPSIVQFLYNNGYNGWIMVEEETEETKTNPDGCVYNIYKYFTESVFPILNGGK